MRHLKTLGLCAVLAASTPAWADLTYLGVGSYNLGSSSGPGATVAANTPCGNISGQDTLEFSSSGVNSIGIHAYACDDSLTNFGSRSSGENTYYAQGIGSVNGLYATSDAGSFAFFVNSGEVGAFGSTAFAAGEFQKASLTIKLTIDGQVYMDEAWSAEVGAGGIITNSHTTGDPGNLTVGTTEASGAGYFSYGITGGLFSVDGLSAGDHDISYVMTSMAAGNITSTVVCTATLYGGKEGVAALVEGQGGGAPFASYCGAGARSGDPFSQPIATPFDGTLPEPMSAGLALTALLAAAGVRRRSHKR